MNVDYERLLFENSVPGADLTRNDLGGYESGQTSMQWEVWKICAARIPERRDMRDPRPADDEPRLCANTRTMWRNGWNSCIEKMMP